MTLINHIITPALRRIWPAVAAAALAAGGAACSGNEDEREVIPAVTNVVEYSGEESGGAASLFTLYNGGSLQGLALRSTAAVGLDSGADAGNSYLLSYKVLEQSGATATVEVTGIGRMNNETLKKSKPQGLEGWNTDPVWLMSLWQSGNKVIMRVQLTYSSSPRRFALVVDESTLSDPYPTAYLFHRRNTDEPNFRRQYYAAFDCSSFWNSESARGLRIRVCNSNVPSLNEFVIEKPH